MSIADKINALVILGHTLDRATEIITNEQELNLAMAKELTMQTKEQTMQTKENLAMAKEQTMQAKENLAMAKEQTMQAKELTKQKELSN